VKGGTELSAGNTNAVTISEDAATSGKACEDGTGNRLLRELAHDLILPAASIKLLANAAYTESDPDAAVRDRLRLIANEAAMIAEICRQVLDRPRRPGPVQLDALAAEAVARAQLRYRGAIEGAISPVTVLVHPAVVVRILNNLLSNACQAAGPRGRVRVRVAPDSAQARLRVEDSGQGLVEAKSGRPALGLEIIGSLVLSCGGTVQMEVSDLGGLRVNVSFSCPLPHEPRPGARPEPQAGPGCGRADRPGPGRQDGSVPG
jgi:signal transduction histidine kinase